MNGEHREDEPVTLAEERLLRLLASLEREDAADASLTQRVMRSVRWQHAVRGVVVMVGTLAGAVGDGLAVLLGIGMRGAGSGETRRDDR